MSVIPYPDKPSKPGKAGPPSAGPKGPTIKMKMRPDLTFDRMTYQDVEYCVVKEPLGQKYYQFPPHVFYLLKQLDGQITIDELQDAYHVEYAPKRINRSELQQLLQRFHRDGLVTSDMPGQGSELLKRGRKNLAMESLTKFSNILAVRYRGFDPERILNFLNKYTWWIFTSTCMWIVLFFASVALLSVLVNFSEFQSRLPGFNAFFDPNQWIMFAGVLAVTKIFHEFGHGLSCKRLGGECHEIGFMLLVLTPCLYCNVSDSWRLSNKWHRAAIGAAGIYVEIILATMATFIWWFVQPGWVQDVCLQVMLISSVSTILFNGNPLLRFDGYYILSDILEIPNLQQKSTKALTTLLGRHWLGLEIPDDHLMPSNRPWAFAMFTVAAFLYRWVIMISIAWFLSTWLKPYHLESLGLIIIMFSAVGMLVWPLYRLYKYMAVPGRMNEVKKGRFTVGLLLFSLIVGLILFIPLPASVRCKVIVVPEQLQTLYVEESGVLEKLFVKTGDRVEKEQTIAVLSNLQLELALKDDEISLSDKLVQQATLIHAASIKPRDEAGREAARRAMLELSRVDTEVTRLQEKVRELKKRVERLTIKSQISGRVIETPYQSADPADQKTVDLESFLSGKNVGIAASRGQRFCEVVDESKWYGVVLLSEDEVAFLDAGSPAKIRLFNDPDNVIEVKIEVSPSPTDRSMDREDYSLTFDQGGSGASLPDLVAELVAAHEQPDMQYYTRVPLESVSSLKVGLEGRAKLDIGSRSLGARMWWWINKHFRT